MTKKEFKEMEAICKRAWRYLARTGNPRKPKYLSAFHQQCPCCEIALRTMICFGSICAFCPIITWRKINPEGTLGNCSVPGVAFARWENANSSEERKAPANEIANMEWSWMKEYKNVVLK